MPGPRRDLQGQDNTPEWDPSLGHVDTAAFLWGRESSQMAPTEKSSQSTARPKPAYQFHEVDDFPVLSQQKDRSANNGTVFNQTTSPTDGGSLEMESPNYQDSRAIYRRSFPAHGGGGYNVAGETDSGVGASMPSDKPNHTINRHSTGLSMGFQHHDPNFVGASGSAYGTAMPSTPGSESRDMPPKLQTSYSTNDIPTMGTNDSNGKPRESNGSSAYPTPQTSTAEQRLHNHNASLGRIPVGAINTARHGRDFSAGFERNEEPRSDVTSVGVVSTPRASYHSPTGNNNINESPSGNTPATSPMSPFGTNNAGFGSLGQSSSLASSLSHLAINSPNGWNGSAMQPFASPYGGNYNTYQGFGSGYQRFSDSQQRVVHERRKRDSEGQSSHFTHSLPFV